MNDINFVGENPLKLHQIVIPGVIEFVPYQSNHILGVNKSKPRN